MVEVAVENVETEVAHLRAGDAQRLRDGARLLVLLIPIVLKEDHFYKQLGNLSQTINHFNKFVKELSPYLTLRTSNLN